MVLTSNSGSGEVEFEFDVVKGDTIDFSAVNNEASGTADYSGGGDASTYFIIESV